MSAPYEHSRERDARRILAYFVRHPEAADSFAGLLRWRLLDEDGQHSSERTEQALLQLLGQGYLREEQIPGGARIVVLDGSNLRRARRFVAAGPEDEQRGQDAPEKRT